MEFLVFKAKTSDSIWGKLIRTKYMKRKFMGLQTQGKKLMVLEKYVLGVRKLVLILVGK